MDPELRWSAAIPFNWVVALIVRVPRLSSGAAIILVPTPFVPLRVSIVPPAALIRVAPVLMVRVVPAEVFEAEVSSNAPKFVND